MFELKKVYTRADLQEFADMLNELSEQIGFKVSSRGWCYQLEQKRLINKDEFDKVESLINRCRRDGLLSINFVAEEEGRKFSGVETPDFRSPLEYLISYLKAPLKCWKWYVPDWWKGEKYYIQMLVEKIDLKTLFEPICERYHIPIATSKGWSSMLQRAEYARRFKEASDQGLKCILLYCGDHDPDGLRISDFLRSNLEDISDIIWDDEETGYDPEFLEIRRFGLDYDFIMNHNLTWIDNLITGSGRNLASAGHKNFKMPYVQQYLRMIGERKCEANAIIVMPDVARNFVNDVIVEYLGEDAELRFENKVQKVRKEMYKTIDKYGISGSIQKLLKDIGEDTDK